MPRRKSPKRRSPTRGRKSPKRRSPTKGRKSPRRKSPKHRSPTRGRKSPKRRRSPAKRRSPVKRRKSPKRRSPVRRKVVVVRRQSTVPRSSLSGSQIELQEMAFKRQGQARCFGNRPIRCFNEPGVRIPGACVRRREDCYSYKIARDAGLL